MVAVRHLAFLNIRNFKRRYGSEGQIRLRLTMRAYVTRLSLSASPPPSGISIGSTVFAGT